VEQSVETNSNTDEMGLPGKGSALNWETTILDHAALDSNCQNDDGDEEPVVEESFEDVVVIST